jgi:uncharacterized protein (TIGR02145 family)
MKYIILIFLSITLLQSCANDGMGLNNNSSSGSIETVRIGSQIWMTKNLDIEKFRNGELIPQATSSREWLVASESGKPVWCYYDFDKTNGEKYGKLYNWFAVNDSRGLAPKGYHVPSDAEWKILAENLGGEDSAGKKLKSTFGWAKGGNGTNESGFNALPGGISFYEILFDYIDFISIEEFGYWWSSTETSYDLALKWNLNCYNTIFRNDYDNKYMCLSVRCVKD